MNHADIRFALEPFGASIDSDGFITKGDKTLGVKAVVRSGRLRFESAEGALLASGRPNAEFVVNFVTRFWHWRKA